MRNLLAGIAAGLALVPLAASAITADDLTAQVASLLAQLNQLQQQLSSLTSGVAPRASVSPLPSTAACPAVIRNLSRGMRGDDVMSLQKFLVAQGSLDADAATGFFGALTEASIKKWQGDHDIVSGGTASTTGWGTVGARTRAAMLSACGGEAAPGNDTLSVSVRGLDASADATV
ncbi:MAG: peptidoglycan-binding domain-containing protein, partial [Candidatus Paceibacterota bacterium]